MYNGETKITNGATVADGDVLTLKAFDKNGDPYTDSMDIDWFDYDWYGGYLADNVYTYTVNAADIPSGKLCLEVYDPDVNLLLGATFNVESGNQDSETGDLSFKVFNGDAEIVEGATVKDGAALTLKVYNADGTDYSGDNLKVEWNDGLSDDCLSYDYAYTVNAEEIPSGSLWVYVFDQDNRFLFETYFSVEAVETYAIAIDENIENGTVIADKTTAAAGETVTLTITPATGYELDTLTVMQGETTVEVSDGNSFTMPNGNVAVTATFKVKLYTVTISSDITNGTVTTDKTTAAYGETVILTVTPDAGYELDTITVTPTVTLTQDADGKYTFAMPSDNVTVNVTFKMIVIEPSYIIMIPASVNLNDNQILTISVSNVENLNGNEIVMNVTSANDFMLVNEAKTHFISYYGDNAKTFTFTQNGSLSIALTAEPAGKPSGTYEDTLTFTANVQSVSAGE